MFALLFEYTGGNFTTRSARGSHKLHKKITGEPRENEGKEEHPVGN